MVEDEEALANCSTFPTKSSHFIVSTLFVPESPFWYESAFPKRLVRTRRRRCEVAVSILPIAPELSRADYPIAGRCQLLMGGSCVRRRSPRFANSFCGLAGGTQTVFDVRD